MNNMTQKLTRLFMILVLILVLINIGKAQTQLMQPSSIEELHQDLNIVGFPMTYTNGVLSINTPVIIKNGDYRNSQITPSLFSERTSRYEQEDYILYSIEYNRFTISVVLFKSNASYKIEAWEMPSINDEDVPRHVYENQNEH